MFGYLDKTLSLVFDILLKRVISGLDVDIYEADLCNKPFKRVISGLDVIYEVDLENEHLFRCEA